MEKPRNDLSVVELTDQRFIRNLDWNDSSLDETGPKSFPFTKTVDFCEHSSVPTIYS
jgi:hypothetical protein